MLARAGRTFVCKRLASRGRSEAEARERLLREAAILRALDGCRAPRLVAEGEDDSGHYFVMEHLNGAPLTRYLEAGVPVPLTWFHLVAADAWCALAELHAKGDGQGDLDIVHGDLAPDNILIAPNERIVFVDFGLASWRHGGPLGTTARGTLLYAAPEVVRGERMDRRSDLFALAATLLHLACAKAPRQGKTEAALVLEAGGEPIERWANDAAKRVTGPLGRALVACVSFQPAQRPSSAKEALVR